MRESQILLNDMSKHGAAGGTTKLVAKTRDARKSPAAIGIAVKSGWAAVVLIDAPLRSPQLVDSRRIELSDPAIPESRQPYHAGFGTARASGPDLSRLLRDVRRFGRRSVRTVIREYAAAGHQCIGAGIVVGSLIDPQRIANAHIRIHALEGQLFRRTVEDAARAGGLASHVWKERDLYGVAADVLKQSEQHVRRTVKALSTAARGTWRAEQKAAAVAAWLMLVASRNRAVRRRIDAP